MSHYSHYRRRMGRKIIDGPHGYRHSRPVARIAADDTSTIAARLQQLGFPDYRSYLASGHWQGLREAYTSREGDHCVNCGRRPIQIHHRTYKRLGREPLTDLVGLCDTCHVAEHLLANGAGTRGRRRRYRSN